MSGCSCCNDITYDSKHFEEGKFHNLELEYSSSFSEFISNVWYFITDDTKDKFPKDGEIKVVKLNKEDILNMPNDSVVRFAHSTLLIKSNEKYILIDPVFSKKITSFPIFAPKRFHEIPLEIKDLPKIDMVILSHNHYDHLDEPSIKELKDKTEFFYVPLGLKSKLVELGIDPLKIYDLDWWQNVTNKDITLSATPAQHFSGRGLFDRDKTLWASWVIKTPTINVFFSGDSGYFDGFKAIGEKYGPFDMAFVEAGAYNDRWKEIHMMPKQSVQASMDLKAKIYFPIHNSTFKLSNHPWYEPLEKVLDESKKQNVQMVHPRFGEIIPIKEFSKTDIWWR